MIYKSKEFYKKIKNKDDEKEIMKETSELRMKIAENFKLDNISFIIGNGCSIYAGAKSTSDFNINEEIEINEEVEKDIKRIEKMDIESQLNSLNIMLEYYRIINEKKKEKIIENIIREIKKVFLNKYVNSLQYNKLNIHELFLLKLRTYGCLNKTEIYTPNYDLAFEYQMDKIGIDYSDGFKGFINRKFDLRGFNDSNKIKLIKIHGSINWVYDKKDKLIKEYQPSFEEGKIVIEKNNFEQALIYPTGEKLYQTYKEPYSELMRTMLNAFETKRNVIIVIGYKYGDSHINDILYKSMTNSNNIYYFFDFLDDNIEFITNVMNLSNELPNINVLKGDFFGDFQNFVKYILPSTCEKTDAEKAMISLYKVFKDYEK